MHSGSVASIADIPGGVWKLCDGTNGTVDLRDRFVVGAGLGTGGSSYTPGAVGGANSKTATSDPGGDHSHGGSTGSHSLTIAQMPAHAHGGLTGSAGEHSHQLPQILYNNDLSGGGAFGYGDYPFNPALFTAAAGAHQHSIPSQGSGDAHSHTISTSGTHTHLVTVDVRPLYYAICFVQRVA